MSIAKGLIFIIFLVMFCIIFALKRENLRQKDYFIKILSHDFRVATLAQLRGVEILANSKKINSEQTELVDEINNSCRYSLELISMLLNIYRFERGEQIIKYEKFFLKEICKNIFLSYKTPINEKNIDLVINIDNSLQVTGDKNLIIKLISNLLSTVISYAKTNSTIILTSTINNKNWNFSITYEGKKLSEEECGRMFMRQTHFSTVGHGIKMYLSKKITDFHNGKIYVENFSDNLNSFTFDIPQREKNILAKTVIISRLQPN